MKIEGERERERCFKLIEEEEEEEKESMNR